MKTSALLLFLLLLRPTLRAENASAAPATVPASSDDAAKLPAVLAPRDSLSVRPVSSAPLLTKAPRVTAETAANIKATTPKFSAVKPADNGAKLPPDLREIDKPRNRIPRLPREMIEKSVAAHASLEGSAEVLQLPTYIVREDKVPNFKEREMLTPQARLDLAYKRHPGLKIGSLPFLSNDGWGLFMLEEEHRLERKAEMEDLYGLYRYSGAQDTKALHRQVQETFMPAASGRN